VRVNLALVSITVTAAVSANGLAADTLTISQRGRIFSPDTPRIVPGTLVRIDNDDSVTHNVYIDQPDMKFDSGEQAVGHAVILRFDREGRFAIRCAIHPTMHLDITVAAEPP
jgi:plastocyanin